MNDELREAGDGYEVRTWVKLATGDSILLGTHILKAVSVTDLVAGRLPFRP